MDAVAKAIQRVFDGNEVPGRIFVGFSGGLDSTVLLHGLSHLASSTTAQVPLERIIAVHVDHGLMPESAEWRRHCETVAGGLGLAFVGEALNLDQGSNLEARARAGRYQVFEGLLEQGDVLLLAHHRDDQDESVLLHLLQGRGLFGMPRRRRLGGGVLLRPLLDLPRSVLAEHAATHQLRWIEDASNEHLAMDRNYLRHAILPPLEARFPGLHARLGRILDHAGATDRALSETLRLERNPLPMSVLDGLSRPAALGVLRRWLIGHDAVGGLSDQSLDDFFDQLQAANDRQPQLELRHGLVRRFRRQLFLTDRPPRLEESYALEPEASKDSGGPLTGRISLPHGELELLDPEANAEGLLVVAQAPVRVGFARDLERGVTLQARGHHRKLTELMREAGLPPWVREYQPLLLDANGVLAIADVAVRDPAPGSPPGQSLRLVWRPGPLWTGSRGIEG